MPRTHFKYQVEIDKKKKKTKVKYGAFKLSKTAYRRFNPSILGLGDVAKEGQELAAIACFFDLQGFTDFCNQIDSHLVIPDFLQRYLTWIFKALADEFKMREQDGKVLLYSNLPMSAKFIGDGIMFLWDTSIKGCERTDITNIVTSLATVCQNYKTDFLPKIKQQVAKPPTALRCGIARGRIISVGDGEDFVGSCINLASRLQKLSSLSFAVSKRGFEKPSGKVQGVWSHLQLKKVQVRGIGDTELVYVLKHEFDSLKPEEKALFKEPRD